MKADVPVRVLAAGDNTIASLPIRQGRSLLAALAVQLLIAFASVESQTVTATLTSYQVKANEFCNGSNSASNVTTSNQQGGIKVNVQNFPCKSDSGVTGDVTPSFPPSLSGEITFAGNHYDLVLTTPATSSMNVTAKFTTKTNPLSDPFVAAKVNVTAPTGCSDDKHNL